MRKTHWAMTAAMSVMGLTLARAADPAPSAPTFILKATQAVVQPGGTVAVDVFVSGAADFAVYQLQLAAAGAGTGGLALEGIQIDKARTDYVFAGMQVVDAVDMSQGRAGALRFSGGVAVTKPMYLATFTFKATADAQGTFKINVRQGEETFILDSASETVPYAKSADVQVAVGSATPSRVETRGRK